MKTLHHITLAAMAALGSAGLHAHGDEGHATKPHAYNAAKREQNASGREGDPKKVSRTIQIDMRDTMRFVPDVVNVRRGETVRFVVTNSGAQLHEMVVGTAEELKAHAEMMRKHPDMVHADANMTHVRPGAKGEIVWQFTHPGAFQFACLIPGHVEAGMVGKVVVP